MAQRAAADLADLVILTSDNPRSEDPAAIIAEMRDGLDPVQMRKVTANTDRAEAIRIRLHAGPTGRRHPRRRQGPREVPGNLRERHPFDDVAVLPNP